MLVQDDHHGLLEAGQGAGPDARRRVGQADLDDVEVEDVDIVEMEDVDVAAAAAVVVVGGDEGDFVKLLRFLLVR